MIQMEAKRWLHPGGGMSCNIMMDYGGIHKFQPPASRLPRVGGTGDT